MQIGQVCNKAVITLKADTTAFETAKMMRKFHVGSIIVCDENNGARIPLGVVTDRDIIVEIISLELDPKVITAGDIMEPVLHVVREDMDVFESIKLMRSKGVRRLPVIDDSEALVGLVSLDDLLKLLASELSTLAKIAVREQANEKELRH